VTRNDSAGTRDRNPRDAFAPLLPSVRTLPASYLAARIDWRAIAVYASSLPEVARLEVAELIEQYADGDDYIQALADCVRDRPHETRAPRAFN
jgi:hypothetical protein